MSQSFASELLEAFHAGEGADSVRQSVRLVTQQLIETAATSRSAPADGNARRLGSPTRTGSRPSLVSTQAGDMELRISKLREGSF